MPRPLYYQGKSPRYTLDRGWVDSRAGLEDVEKRNFLTLPRLELRPIGPPASSQSLYRLRYLGSNINVELIFTRFCSPSPICITITASWTWSVLLTWKITCDWYVHEQINNQLNPWSWALLEKPQVYSTLCWWPHSKTLHSKLVVPTLTSADKAAPPRSARDGMTPLPPLKLRGTNCSCAASQKCPKEPERSLPCLQEPSTSPCPETNPCSPIHPILSL
jgi:hypothetical protein